MNSITATSAVGAGDEATPQPRLVRAAHEFEAQMMKELMKPLTWDNSLTGADKDSDGAGGVCLGGAGPGAERAGRLWNSGWSCQGTFPFR